LSVLPPIPVEDLDHVLTHTLGLWEELRGQSLFITGGTGFFGHWLLETFNHANDTLSLGAKATVLSRNSEALAQKSPHLAARSDLVWTAGDVRDFRFPEGQFRYVIHAGTTSGAPVEPLEMFDTIVQGTRRVLDFAASHGARKFLFTSSGAVYGRQPSELTHLAEDYRGAPDTLDPASAYGEGKRAAELLCTLLSQKHGFEAKIARCFAFVGPHLPLDQHFAAGNFLRDALAGRPIQVGGDGTALRSYLHAADLAVWLWTLLFAGKAGQAYNVGSEEAVSIGELAHAAATLREPPLPVEIAQAATPGVMPMRYVPAAARASAEFGLETRLGLAEALHRTYRWHAA